MGEERKGLIFHLALQHEWERAVEAGEYGRSTRGHSLEDIGFVHLATAAQVQGVAERFYADETEPLVLLTIDPTLLSAEVVYEPAVVGGEDFPHLYGPLPVVAVVNVEQFHRPVG